MVKYFHNEEHILSLIPRNQFHSCILTTFSFDFKYFYHEVRSQLNRADIINTNVLVDDAMLQRYLGTMTGYANDCARKFAITGVPVQKGVFHPKLGLFMGDKEKGLLVIGSGNLTASGHGKNRELWGAFHIDGPNDPKAPLLREAWEYLLNFKMHMAGISRQKVAWMEKYASWISKIPRIKNGEWVPLDDHMDAQLLINSNDQIWNLLKQILVNDTIEEVTLLSPFFDARGETLNSLCNLAGDAEVHLVAQPERCVFPNLTNFSIPSNLVCHDWNTIHPANDDDNESFTRYVHAKLLHIKTKGPEYCLIGSANLTTAGMGADSVSAVNEEASILLRANTDSFNAQLSLENRGAIISPEEMAAHNTPIEGIFTKAKGDFRIKGVDCYTSTLHIYIDQIETPTGLELRLYDGWEEQLDKISIDSLEYSAQHQCYMAGFTTVGEIFFAQLYSAIDNVPVSNKVVVHDARALLNTNPDPANKQLEKVIAQIETGQSDLISLLKYISPDDIIDSKPKKKSTGNAEDGKKNEHQDGTGKQLEYDEFTRQSKVDDISGAKLYANNGHSIERVVELVRLLLQRAADQAAYYQNTDEEDEKDNLDASEGKEDEAQALQEPIIPPQKASKFSSSQRQIRRFVEKYIKTMTAQLERKAVLTQLDHSLFAVVIHLLIDFYKKPFMVEDKESGKSHRMFLINSQQDFFARDDFCRYVAEVIGLYSLLLEHQTDRELNPYEKSILVRIRTSAYWNAVCAIGLVSIVHPPGKKEETWIWELFMNLRHNSGLDDCKGQLAASEHLRALANIINTDDRDAANAQIQKFWQKHEQYYQDFDTDKEGTRGITEVGQRVFSKKFGFCHISSCEDTKIGHKIALARPGYKPDPEMAEFSKETKIIAEKCILKVV